MAYNLGSLRAQQISVIGTYQGQNVVNVFMGYVKTNGTTTFPVVAGSTALLNRFESLWVDNICPLLSDGYAVVRYVAKQFVEPTGPTTQFTYDAAAELEGGTLDVGSGGAASLPAYANVSANLRTNGYGRSYKGRKAFAPIPEASTVNTAGSGQTLTDTALLAWQTAIATLMPSFTVGAGATGFIFQTGVGSLKRYKLGSVDWLTDISGVITNPLLGTQLSRKRRPDGLLE